MLQGVAADCNSAEATHAWFDSRIAHHFHQDIDYQGFQATLRPVLAVFRYGQGTSIHGWQKAGRYLGADRGRSVDPRHVPPDLQPQPQPQPGPRRLAKGGNASFAKAVRIIVAQVAERDQLIGPLGTDDSHARSLAKQVTIGS
jgi:hypothetical protein